MSKPITTRLRVMVKSECYNVNPVALQVPVDSEHVSRKHKIECHSYGEKDHKSRQDSESSFHVESTNILADPQWLHPEEAVSNEKTGAREKYPKPNPAKKNVVIRINEMIRENQNHTDTAQAVEGRQMSLAGVDRVLLKRTHVFAQGTRNSTARHNDDSCWSEQALSLSNQRGARYIP